MLKINDFESQNMLQTKNQQQKLKLHRKNNGNVEAFNNKIKPHRNCHLLFAHPLWYSFELKLSRLRVSLSLWCICNSSADISLASSHSTLGSHSVHFASCIVHCRYTSNFDGNMYACNQHDHSAEVRKSINLLETFIHLHIKLAWAIHLFSHKYWGFCCSRHPLIPFIPWIYHK